MDSVSACEVQSLFLVPYFHVSGHFNVPSRTYGDETFFFYTTKGTGNTFTQASCQNERALWLNMSDTSCSWLPLCWFSQRVSSMAACLSEVWLLLIKSMSPWILLWLLQRFLVEGVEPLLMSTLHCSDIIIYCICPDINILKVISQIFIVSHIINIYIFYKKEGANEII